MANKEATLLQWLEQRAQVYADGLRSLTPNAHPLTRRSYTAKWAELMEIIQKIKKG